MHAWSPREKHSRPGSNSYAWPLRHAHLSPMRQLNCRGVYLVQLECTFTWRRGGYSDTKHILCSCQTQLSSTKRYDLSRNSGPNAPHIGWCVPLGVPVGPMMTLCGNTINGRCLIRRYGVFRYDWAWLGAWSPREKHSRPGSNSYAWPLRHAHLSPMRQWNCRGVYLVQLECTFTWRRGGYSDTKHILCSCQTQLSSISEQEFGSQCPTYRPACASRRACGA